MADAKPKDLVALRRISLPAEHKTRENNFVEPGETFTPASEGSRERLLRINAAAEPSDKEAKEAKKAADDSADDSKK